MLNKRKIGMIGLGRMGFNMSLRLIDGGHSVVVWNRNQRIVKKIVKRGAMASESVESLVEKLRSSGDGKIIIWLMLPAGNVTDVMINNLIGLLNEGDIIIDGANDFYKNAERHGNLCSQKKINFFDVGVSGGTHGLKNGYTLMVGGDKKKFKYIEPFCKTLAPPDGYGYFGSVGSGHFVKSVHNIVEYIYLQGIAEGVELLDKKGIDINKAVGVWSPASVIKSWLIDLTAIALSRKDFSKINSDISSVTIKELKDTKNSVKGFTPAFDVATKIRRDKSGKFKLGKKIISAVRREFGGHSVKKVRGS